jgi:transcriptional regulator with XRE-family HTH domain
VVLVRLDATGGPESACSSGAVVGPLFPEEKKRMAVDTDRVRSVGSSLAAIRKARGWTLQEFSDLTTVSVSTLSKIENGQVVLSFATVLKIVDGLGLSIDELLANGKGAVGRARRVVDHPESAVRLSTDQYEYEIFATELQKKTMVPLITTVKARDISEWPAFSKHEGEEWMYVLEGAVEIHTDSYAPLVLKKGDSIYIDSGMGHAMISLGQEDARVLSVVYGSDVLAESRARKSRP